MIGSDITAEIAMKIGSVLTLKCESRIASRAALPATNDDTTISALIAGIRAAPRWSSCGAMALSGHLRLLVLLLRHELIVQLAGAERQQQPHRGEGDVQRGQRLHAEARDAHEEDTADAHVTH